MKKINRIILLIGLLAIFYVFNFCCSECFCENNQIDSNANNQYVVHDNGGIFEESLNDNPIELAKRKESKTSDNNTEFFEQIVFKYPENGACNRSWYGSIEVSPFNDDHIWVLGNNMYPCDLNIQTGEWTSVKSSLGSFSMGISQIVKDGFDKDIVWIRNFHEGLLSFNISEGLNMVFDNTNYFNGNSLSAIAVDKTCVWIGTSQGLYVLLKDTGIVRMINQLKDIWINDIHIENESLWINGKYVYYPANDMLVNISDVLGFGDQKITRHLYAEKYKMFSTFNNDMLFDENNRLIYTFNTQRISSVYVDGNILWFGGESIVKFDIENNTIEQSYDLSTYDGKLHNSGDLIYFESSAGFGKYDKRTGRADVIARAKGDFAVNKNNIYVKSGDGVFKINKDGIDTRFESLLNIQKVRRELEELESLISNDESIINKIQHATSFFKLLNEKTDISDIEKMKYDIHWSLRVDNKDEMEIVKEFIRNTELDSEKEVACYVVVTSSLVLGEINQSLEYYNYLNKDFSEGIVITMIGEEGERIIHDTFKKQNEIINKDIPESEKLWELGLLFYDAVQVWWNENEVGWNMTYPSELFSKLITKYPDSAYADKASYHEIMYNEGLEHEGGKGSLMCINDFEAFIKKYPTSELIPDAKMEIADHYFYLNESYDYQTLCSCYDKAKSIYLKILKTYRDTEYSKNAKKRLNELEQARKTSCQSVRNPSDNISHQPLCEP